MARFRKRPVEIEAFRWDGTAGGATPIVDWVLANGATATYVCSNPDRCGENDGDTPHCIVIRTLEGDMCADVGDWIIKGVKGEFYPCKPDIFDATYEPLTAHDAPQERVFHVRGVVSFDERELLEIVRRLSRKPRGDG